MRTLISIYLYVLLLSHCKYDNTVAASNLKLPDYTETGENTFGALIAGNVWLNFGKYRHGTELGTNYPDNIIQRQVVYNTTANDTSLYLGGQLTVLQKGNTIRNESVEFNVKKHGSSFKGQYLLGTFTYVYNGPAINHMIYTNGPVGEIYSVTTYISLDKNPLKLMILKDAISGGKHIISGTFDGYLYNSNYLTSRLATDSIHVTSGVFDVDLLSNK